MTSSATELAAWDGAEERLTPGLAARAVLLLFSFSVPIDALAVPGVAAVVLGAGVALLATGALSVIRTRRWRPIPASLLWLLAYTWWTGVTLLWAHNLRLGQERALTNLQLLASVWLAWQLTWSRRDVRAAMAGFVLGCGVVSLGAWRSFSTGLTQVEMKYGPGMNFDEARYVALGFDPNDMGLTLAIGIVMAGYLGLGAQGRSGRLWLAYMPLAASAILLSGSRGAAAATVFAIGAVLWSVRRRSPRALVVALGLLAAAGAVVWLVTPDTWERLFTLRQQLAGGTLGDRLPIWRAGWGVFMDNPFAGVGVANFPDAAAPRLGYWMVTHNTPLSIAAESGLVGLFLFGGALVSIARAAWRAASRVDRDLVLGSLLTWFVGVATLTWEYRKTTWLLLLLGAAVGELSRRDAASETS